MTRIVLDLDEGPYPDLTASILLQLLGLDDSSTAAWLTAQVKAQLPRPKPEEPIGLGAVVEDAEGNRWLNHRDETCIVHKRPWELHMSEGTFREYADIDAVRVLSEGVTDASP